MVGQPAERISAAGEQVDADLIAMSTHGYLVPPEKLVTTSRDWAPEEP